MVPITQIQGVPIADRVEVTAGSLPARYFGRDVHEGGLLSCAEAAALTSLGLLAVSSHADEGASPRQQSTTLSVQEAQNKADWRSASVLRVMRSLPCMRSCDAH
eukprot:GEMP01091376.1.p1 GENE.GEMP01091376.1~~GEMP01091376.1.p1  ORF type:complete len:104 (+),score=23.91 GEMP01091376.1:190-501(+)